MSYGKKCELYCPVQPAMVSRLNHFYPSAAPHIENLYKILTQNCIVETLLFVSIVDCVERYLAGEQDAGFRLSILRRDGKGKIQTRELEILHDVVVELQMAGENFEWLQQYLLRELRGKFVFFHSCGKALVPVRDIAGWYQDVRAEQVQRTVLDWSGSMEKKVSEEYARQVGIVPEKLFENLHRIFQVSDYLLKSLVRDDLFNLLYSDAR
jgi:hypothetical protein